MEGAKVKEVKVLDAREVIRFYDLPLCYDATRKDQITTFSEGTGEEKEKYSSE